MRTGLAVFSVSSVLLAPLLTGCGNQVTPGFNGKINDANGLAVAATSYYAGAAAIPFASVGNLTVTGVAASGSGGGFNLADFARVQIEALAASEGQYPSSVLTGVVTSIPYQCRSGSGTIQWDDKDQDGKFSKGDTFDFTFQNCAVRNFLGTFVYNNKMSMTNFSLKGDPQGDPSAGWTMGALFSLEQLSVTSGQATRVYSGDFNFSSSTIDGERETIDISGDSLTGTVNNAADVLKAFTINESDDRASFTYSFQVNGSLDSAQYGALSIKTLAPFAGTTPFEASSGAMLITAADKSSVRMTVNSSTAVTIEIDANGDGTVDTTRDTAWSVLSEALP